ncbi:hypothetical protein EVAR_46791_1 [Eumeta japonica]|uniref:Uncharacterized protein n=1 Tax=Eumeta variegata TaxID=151549 RepID=A0A4C1XDG8_EUMVA|nr:hypothetical protein EVAR_46791_1 [Eumeta japonica]
MQLSKTPLRRDFITPKLVVALDRCQLSMRDSMFIFEATIEAFGYYIDEFSISGDIEKKIKIQPPGGVHQARWTARAIYSLKISLFSAQCKITSKDKAALIDVCLFIVISYVEPWHQFTSTIKSPYFVLWEINEVLREN